MTRIVEIDPREITITPVFKHIEVEDVPQSEVQGQMIMKMVEAVEVRFAGSKNYSPVFPTDAQWKREGNQIITYAERWPEQYRAFKEGSQQEAAGTPLEMLRTYGVTPELLSLCRTARVYSIESLHHLEGQNLRTLGMNANRLKEAAAKFMADRQTGRDSFDEIAALRAQVAELMARSTVPPVVDSTPEQIEAAVQQADEEYAGYSDDDLKAAIAEKFGSRPRGTPTRNTLLSMLRTAA